MMGVGRFPFRAVLREGLALLMCHRGAAVPRRCAGSAAAMAWRGPTPGATSAVRSIRRSEPS